MFGETIQFPNPEDVLEFRPSVSEDFRLTVNVPNSITLSHRYKKRKADPPVENPRSLSPAVLMNVNNPYEECAPLAIRRLQARLGS